MKKKINGMNNRDDDEDNEGTPRIGIEVGGDIPEILKRIIERKLSGSGRSNLVTAHYGMKEEDFQDMINNMLCDMIKENDKTKLLDKYFPTLDGTGRLKVLAFLAATDKVRRLQD